MMYLNKECTFNCNFFLTPKKKISQWQLGKNSEVRRNEQNYSQHCLRHARYHSLFFSPQKFAYRHLCPRNIFDRWKNYNVYFPQNGAIILLVTLLQNNGRPIKLILNLLWVKTKAWNNFINNFIGLWEFKFLELQTRSSWYSILKTLDSLVVLSLEFKNKFLRNTDGPMSSREHKKQAKGDDQLQLQKNFNEDFSITLGLFDS